MTIFTNKIVLIAFMKMADRMLKALDKILNEQLSISFLCWGVKQNGMREAICGFRAHQLQREK